MTEIERISATLAIHALKSRYFQALDAKDWKGLEAVFTPDVRADFRDSAGPRDESMLFESAAAYIASVAPILEHVSTVHHGHMPEIRIESPTSATGIWAMEDKLWVAEGSELPFRWMHGYGHYHERYVVLNGEWRIKETRLTRLRVDAG